MSFSPKFVAPKMLVAQASQRFAAKERILLREREHEMIGKSWDASNYNHPVGKPTQGVVANLGGFSRRYVNNER
jgi:hypothetical protein